MAEAIARSVREDELEELLALYRHMHEHDPDIVGEPWLEELCARSCRTRIWT
ncbi:hypothetical protein [Paenibacillus methanolicus]|uniref:Uncharacterized protein n=1 Tax=Paenibacillus methanolicus TaxID=582686 RepID=A0A5S5BSS0_9BACL|nr:hypothetical protein [Paenibacillus methanolicus]TYP70057.1 hypothetical protein BCM02_11235 [Paenibacillus methanolicus]